jgi:hypothetical protein
MLRLVIGVAAATLCAQDLAPRAYVITPVGANAVTLSYSYNRGPIFGDPTVPIENLSGSFQDEILTYYRSFGFLGRSSNVTVFLPYANGNLDGTVDGNREHVYRSGLLDGRFRFSVNLLGGPAMSARQYSLWKEKTTVGASLLVSVPSGQYDPVRLINGGNNRLSFKPEVGLSHRWGKWVLDCYGGVTFFTPNKDFYPGQSTRAQTAIPVGEAHFGYYVRQRFWATLDANFWNGGAFSINGGPQSGEQRNSRTGATVSLPVGPHQSFKLSYSAGAYVTIGGNFKTVSAAWQYSWLGKPE